MYLPPYYGGTWNGIAIVSKTRTITRAYANFTVPKALAKTGEVAYWLGVGGSNRQPMDLCQAGISVGGNNQDGLIAEDYPSPPLGGPTVKPGDAITVSIYPYAHWYRVTVKDINNGHSLTTGCRVPMHGGWRHEEFIGEESANPLKTTLVWAAWHSNGAQAPHWIHWLGFTQGAAIRWMTKTLVAIKN